MTQQSGKKEISLGEDFGDVVVKVNGARVEVNTDGSVLVYTNGNVTICQVANDDGKTAASAEPKIGDKMPDGTIYAGISPETNKPMYTTPKDAPVTMAFKEAKAYAVKLNAHGHQNWRLPTKAELDVLYDNRAAIGGFDSTGSYPASYYVSSEQYDYWLVFFHRFSDGAPGIYPKTKLSAVRCVL